MLHGDGLILTETAYPGERKEKPYVGCLAKREYVSRHYRSLLGSTESETLLIGNEAIARGAIEAGVGYASAYPGTPSSEISEMLREASWELSFYFEFSTNEKVALEGALAAANAGVRSLCVMKHVGLNVASDCLVTMAYLGVEGGLVIVSADDPHIYSSQNEQDNRYYGRLAAIPILEPSSVEEAKEMMKSAFDLSEQLGEPVLFRTTTRLNHASAAVKLGPILSRPRTGRFERKPFQKVAVPVVSRELHKRLLVNLDRAREISENSPYNFVEGSGANGIVTSGVSYNYVFDALDRLGVKERFSVLRLGQSYPVPEGLVSRFLKDKNKVLVVEEGEPLLEQATQAIAQKNALPVPIAGKGPGLFRIDSELGPAVVEQCVVSYFEIENGPQVLELPPAKAEELPPRPPTLCCGCGHRATYYVVKKAAEGMDVIYPSDIGCYTLGLHPPLNMTDIVVCMGASVGMACGFSRTTSQKSVAFIGDSTFFHSGIPGLINGVFNRHSFTLIVMDNGTTAMTGHQPHPGVDMRIPRTDHLTHVSIEKIVRAVGVEHVAVIDPFQVDESIETTRKALEFEGISVVIARAPCALYASRSGKNKGKGFTVNEKCQNDKKCIEALACPAFYVHDDKVRINSAICTGCSLCASFCEHGAIIPTEKS